MTHLQWLCEIKRYLCYISRLIIQVILGRIQWQGSGGVSVIVFGTQWIQHPNYNPSTLANDIALLRIPAVTLTSKYPSPVSTYVVCVCVCSAATCDRCSTLWLLQILAVKTGMIECVTDSDKVIITKGGQQTGPTLSINHAGEAAFHKF